MIRLETNGGVEVAHAAAAPVDSAMAGEISDESPEVLDPCVVVVPEEEVYHLLVALLRDVEWRDGLAFVVLECELIYTDSQLILDCWDVFDGQLVGDVDQSILMEHCCIVVGPFWVTFDLPDCRQDCVAKTPIWQIVQVDEGFLDGEQLR